MFKNAEKPVKFAWILQTDGRSTFKSAFSDVFSNEPHVPECWREIWYDSVFDFSTYLA